jgi:hypothetical protein
MVSAHRVAPALTLSASLLVLLTVTSFADQQSEAVATRNERVQRQFDRVSREFTIGPYYSSDYVARSSSLRSYFPPSYFSSSYFSSSYFSRAFPYATMRNAYSPQYAPGPGAYPLARNPYSPPLGGDVAGQDPYRLARDPYLASRDPTRPLNNEVPLPISRERRVTDMVLMVGVRALLYVAALGLLAQMMPKPVWAQILERNNTALAIVLAAVVLALGIVISAPLD